MKVTLLRHAQTAGNVLGQYIGSTNEDICEQGYRRAEAVPVREDVNVVYTSDLSRTQQTARILYPHARLVCCDGLDEMDFGLFEQKTWRDLEDNAAYRSWVDSNCETTCPDGEAKPDFTQRCVNTFLRIVQEEASRGSNELHIIAHGGTIMAILSQLAVPVLPYFDWHADFCGGYLLEYQNTPEPQRPLTLINAIRPKEQTRLG